MSRIRNTCISIYRVTGKSKPVNHSIQLSYSITIAAMAFTFSLISHFWSGEGPEREEAASIEIHLAFSMV